jgi:hypothetical protein
VSIDAEHNPGWAPSTWYGTWIGALNWSSTGDMAPISKEEFTSSEPIEPTLPCARGPRNPRSKTSSSRTHKYAPKPEAGDRPLTPAEMSVESDRNGESDQFLLPEPRPADKLALACSAPKSTDRMLVASEEERIDQLQALFIDLFSHQSKVAGKELDIAA